MNQEETETVFTKTVRFRCDFPDCKDARDKRDYSATTMEEHMANHFISLQPSLKQYIHQYPCSCGQVFATQYHFTVHLYQFRLQHHRAAHVKAQWNNQKFLDAQAQFHSRFYPLYVAYKPFPKRLKLYPGYPIPDRVVNNDDNDDYDRSRRSATPGCNTPGSFNMSRNASPSPSRGGGSRAQSPYNGRGFTPSVQRSGERWNSDFHALDIRGLETPAKDTSTNSHDGRDARSSRNLMDSSNERSSYNTRDSSSARDSRRSRHSEYQENRHESTRRSPRKKPPPQESTYTPQPVPPPILPSIIPPPTLLPSLPTNDPPTPVQQEFSKPFDEDEFLRAFQRRFPCTNIKSSPLPILDTKPKIKITLKHNSNEIHPQNSQKESPDASKPIKNKFTTPPSSSFLSKINTKKRKAPTPPDDNQDKLRPENSSAISISCPPSLETSIGISGQWKNNSQSIDQLSEKPHINLNYGQDTTEDLDSNKMFQSDEDQQEILLRQNSRSSYMPLRSNTQRHSVPSANLTADDEDKISNFRPKSGRPEKPKMVANPPFMDVVPNQGSRDRRSRSRSATPSRRSRSRSVSRGPSQRKSPVHLSASDRRQSRSFARHSLRNK
ncbi:unnamed protein product [Auanema sp. JU1783]|nr:unnamed protein product [Auanema sp. JU1783]